MCFRNISLENKHFTSTIINYFQLTDQQVPPQNTSTRISKPKLPKTKIPGVQNTQFPSMPKTKIPKIETTIPIK